MPSMTYSCVMAKPGRVICQKYRLAGSRDRVGAVIIVAWWNRRISCILGIRWTSGRAGERDFDSYVSLPTEETGVGSTRGGCGDEVAFLFVGAVEDAGAG